MLRPLTLVALLAACAVEPGPVGRSVPAVDAPRGGVGSTCRTDADCGDAAWTCDLSLPGGGGLGICTDDCVDSPGGDEAALCGDPDATCLSLDPGAQGLCTRVCDPDVKPGAAGACPAHQVCTSHSLWHPDETPGCEPFCHDDAGCGPYQDCDTRTGRCVGKGRAVQEGGGEDGTLCDPYRRDGTGRSLDCLGECQAISGAGLCASYVDLAVTKRCPDLPGRISPLAGEQDNLGLCIVRSCDGEQACPEGTACAPCPVGGGYCCAP